MNTEERVLRAQLGAHTSWANTADPASRTAKARKAAQDRFLKQARQEHPEASEQQVQRIAGHLRAAFYKRMQLASAKARRRNANAKAKTASRGGKGAAA